MPERPVSAVVAATASRLGSVAEARLLLAHALGVEPNRLLLADPPDAAALARLDAGVARREAGEPLQHITGSAPFRTVTLEVGPGVFIPRPETEVMTGWALDRLAEIIAAGVAEPRVVELCAGSGAITKALATEASAGSFHCVELSPDAWPYLAANLAGLHVDARLGDMADAFGDLDGTVDLVIANPPYVPLEHWADVPAEVRDFDPALALVSGEDGLDAMRVVAEVAARLLRPGGFACAEHAEVQVDSAPAVFVATGAFTQVRDRRDLTDRPRFVTAVRAGRMVP
ncbi:peptide chain release factor N(5)-glutamine methyltransferase [Propioniciclava coleopterorum]|uniref:Peptide chain release factor N(5)-glutamine methyltransferase n=1 Tax=Propioniciclava coleopterorum TaxID=2714937 RepID=A0A6G7Y9C5_9ACTN|nr:peptide chain release factor N(5)-glutamine methyltransferase [Propioniciclava coleopterorum]QIK73319.1 peptide chain release factor N(5)-glutamine methyltransferase [Propioniciclava coleopterorum]